MYTTQIHSTIKETKGLAGIIQLIGGSRNQPKPQGPAWEHAPQYAIICDIAVWTLVCSTWM